jgi:hypothetical protein
MLLWSARGSACGHREHRVKIPEIIGSGGFSHVRLRAAEYADMIRKKEAAGPCRMQKRNSPREKARYDRAVTRQVRNAA